MYGWAGKVLRVNLSTREIDKEPLNQEWAQDFIGGRGLNIRTLYDEVTSATDPMSPENPLIIGVGPCNGTLVAGSSRLTVTTKSPLTGFLGDASTGATFGAELKYAGYDQIIIRGKSDKPVYLWIEDDKVEIRDAAHLWGKNVVPTISSLEQECKAPGIGLLCIGPAGENLVRFATIMGPMGRAAGRTGVGTVMGSKKLKARVVKGSRGVQVAHPERLEETFREMRRVWLEDRKEDYERKVKYGLNELLWAYRRLDIASVRNYQGGEFEGWDNYDPKLLQERYYLKSKSCFGCPLPWDKVYVVKDGPYAGTHGAGFEISQMHATASRMGLSDPDLIIYLDTMLDEYGIDIMDWAGVTGLAVECYQQGLLGPEDTGGLKLEWGNGEAMLALLDMIVYRKGFGDVLADGIKRAVEKIGPGAEKYAMHVKGLALDAMDPRGSKGWGLGYAVSSRGAEHCRFMAPDFAPGVDRLAEDDKPALVKWCEECRAVQHCLETCIFAYPYYNLKLPDFLAKIYQAVTGLGLSAEQLMKVGERVINLERCFNLREGLSKADDTLPDRFVKEPMPSGATKGQTIGIGPMVDKYYELRGWEVETGLPRKANLEALGLAQMAGELASLGKLGK